MTLGTIILTVLGIIYVMLFLKTVYSLIWNDHGTPFEIFFTIMNIVVGLFWLFLFLADWIITNWNKVII